MKRQTPKILDMLIRLFLLTAVLLSCSVLPAFAATVNLLGVMDAHAYRSDAVSADVILPYRIYLPDALSPYFPAGADNASAIDMDAAENETVQDASGETDSGNTDISVPGDTTYGLFIWLHDEDCRGDDNVSHISDDTKNGLINAFLSDTARAQDTVILAPQCPAGMTWKDNGGVLLNLIADLVKNQICRLPIDQNRILVAGISMGAEAGYEWIAAQGQTGALPIAAAYLVAGTTSCKVNSEADAAPFKNTAIYAFLSENDTVTPPDSVRSLADTLNETYGCTFRYAVYPEVGHEIWHQAFAEQDLINTFLSTNAPLPVTPAVQDTEAPDKDEPPAETEVLPSAETTAAVTETTAVTADDNQPLSIAGFEITSVVIAYGILALACVLSLVILLTGLFKNNRAR